MFGVVWALNRLLPVTLSHDCALLEMGYAEKEAADKARIAAEFERRRQANEGKS